MSLKEISHKTLHVLDSVSKKFNIPLEDKIIYLYNHYFPRLKCPHNPKGCHYHTKAIIELGHNLCCKLAGCPYYKKNYKA